jgi:natural product precursor
MKKLSKISLKTISDKMAESEMKMVLGGASGSEPCAGKKAEDSCTYNGHKGVCRYNPVTWKLQCVYSSNGYV